MMTELFGSETDTDGRDGEVEFVLLFPMTDWREKRSGDAETTADRRR
jgi:hypothetical protein